MSDAPRAGHEAARLLAAAQDWLRASAPDLAPVGEDGETCACPLCRAVVAVREADPDSVARWVDSAVAAATATLAQVSEQLAPETGAATPDTDGTDDTDDGGYAVDPDEAPVGTDDDSVPPTPSDGAEGQDGTRTRGVRRIPLSPEGDEPAG